MLLIYCIWNIFSLSSSLFLGYYSASVFGISNILGLVICTFPSLGTSAEWRELFSWERIDSVCVFVRDQTMANYSLTLSPSRMCWQLILTLLLWFFQNGATSVDMMTHLHDNSFTWWNNRMTHLHDDSKAWLAGTCELIAWKAIAWISVYMNNISMIAFWYETH